MSSVSQIPIFPTFSQLTLEHKTFFDSYVTNFEPVSDFNFSSLWAWNTDKKIEVSMLNDNLVVKFVDYTENYHFLSFLGQNQINETALTLLNFAKENKLPTKLKLIPESVIEKISEPSLEISEDRMQFDYIYSTQHMSKMEGNVYKTKRRMANKFKSMYPTVELVELDFSNNSNHKNVFNLMDTWMEQHHTKKELYDSEIESINRLIEITEAGINTVNLYVLKVSEQVIGFALEEKTHEKHNLSHFSKTNHEYEGVTEYFNQILANELYQNDILYWNWEQDVDDESLKAMKLGYRPEYYLKKYCIELSNTST